MILPHACQQQLHLLPLKHSFTLNALQASQEEVASTLRAHDEQDHDSDVVCIDDDDDDEEVADDTQVGWQGGGRGPHLSSSISVICRRCVSAE